MSTKKINSLRILAASYFSICTLGFTLIVKYFLVAFNKAVYLPLFSTGGLAIFLGALFGSLFAKQIATTKKLSHVFALGALLGFIIVPFFSLGLQVIYYLHNDIIYHNIHYWTDYLVLYGVFLLLFFLIAGIWFIPLIGVVTLIFKQRFLPKWLTYLSQIEPSKKVDVHDVDTQ